MTQTSAILNPAATSPEVSVVAAAASKHNNEHNYGSSESLAQQEAKNTDFAALVQNTISANSASEHLTSYKIANSSQQPMSELLSSSAESILFSLQHGALPSDKNNISASSEEISSSIDSKLNGQLSPEVLATLLNSIEAESSNANTIQANGTQNTDDGSIDISSLLTFIINQSNNDQLDGNTLLDSIISHINSTDSNELILSNLTPEERTELQSIISSHSSSNDLTGNNEILEKIYTQFVTLTQPPVKKSDSGTTSSQNISVNTATSPQTADAELASALSSEVQDASNSKNSSPTINATKDGDEDINLDTFKKAIDNSAKEANNTTNSRNNAADPPPLSTQQKTTAIKDLQTLISTNGTIPVIDGTAAQSTPIQSSLTMNITQSQSAAHAHPATQMVSATIQKAIKTGEDTNIKLTLNPSELGRVEVKMSIDQDNISKIVLTAEKPETFMMLRRDADMLEKMLADSGLDAKSNLSFEMAKDNQQFDKNHNDDNGTHSANSTDNYDDAEEIIETTMNWTIDPNSGHAHYNIII